MYVCIYVLFSVVNKVVPLVYSPFFILIHLLKKNSCNVKLLLFPIFLSIFCACILIYPSSFAFILLPILFPLFIANVTQMPNIFFHFTRINKKKPAVVLSFVSISSLTHNSQFIFANFQFIKLYTTTGLSKHIIRINFHEIILPIYISIN